MKLNAMPSRRTFLTGASATALGPVLAHARAPANERIQIAVIGVGAHGRRMLDQCLREKDVELVAVCDVVGARNRSGQKTVRDSYARERKGAYKGCSGYNDYRKLLEKKNLDAVLVATPNHMHVHPALAAIARKLDVYCETPLTHNIAEGRLLADAAKERKIVFQTGSPFRHNNGRDFRAAVELIWAGRIGKLQTIRVGVGAAPFPCDLPDQETPDDVDWDLWLGPAPQRGYHKTLFSRNSHGQHLSFRNYEEYGGGKLADQGAHFFDVAQWAMGMDRSGPTMIEPPAVSTSGLRFTYANGVQMLHMGNDDISFKGTEGTILVRKYHPLVSNPPSLAEEPLGKDDRRAPASVHALRNWLDAIKTRKEPINPAETGHRSATVCHLANIGYKLRRKLTWDPAKEQFIGDNEANKLVTRRARRGWEYD